jgi:dihydrofolate reductase
MTKTVLSMSMSLDGYVTGPQDSVDAPMGIDGMRLFNWLDRRNDPGPSGQVFGELMGTRAVIAGRRTYEHAGRWSGDHHDGVPVFVLTHHPPDGDPPGSVQYVTDGVAAAVTRARTAAGDGDVMVQGATTAQELLRAGLLDEMEIHLVPVLLGQGRRLFDSLRPEHIELDLIRTLQAPDVTHLHYRVRAGGAAGAGADASTSSGHDDTRRSARSGE